MHTGLLLHKTVDILSFPSRVGADIDGIHITSIQQPAHDLKLFLNAVDHFIFELFRNKWNGLQ